jgi:DmsE family decaheme c-type cytochrome
MSPRAPKSKAAAALPLLWHWIGQTIIRSGVIMRRLLSPGRGQAADLQGIDRGRLTTPRRFFLFATLTVICGVLFAMSASVRASDRSAVQTDSVAALRNYVQQIGANPSPDEDARQAASDVWHEESVDNAYAALRTFAEGASANEWAPVKQLKLAEADNAFDALRDFLQKHNGTAPTPAQPAPPPRPAPSLPLPPINASIVGTKACLGCHASVADIFSHTMMGRLETQGKLQCETCHGPGSAHVQSAGCAACHGDGGVTVRPGFPSLVGQEPPYLVAAMKAYVNGQRHHAMMKALIAGLSDAELNNIAVYYAHQPAAPARTPPIGDPAAGRAAAAACAGCHGDRGIAISPAWPNLAGQDAQSLANALHFYRDGSRNKVIACAACHGDGGVSRISGMPTLAGLEPQYLVAAMKAYVNGQRKHAIMKALLVGVSDAELNSIANYYAAQKPMRAQTPSFGDATAGKALSATCDGCHSAATIASSPTWPGLAGQDARYFADTMRYYKNGSRNDQVMKPSIDAMNLDDKAINDLAAYYASLTPAQPHPGSGPAAKRDPVVTRNGLVAMLDERTINNAATYYASLPPVQPESAKNAQLRPVPALVSAAAPPNGLSPGGIISYRKDDPGRTVEENNAICLNCHERGDRTYWAGSVHDNRGLACTECHTVMKNVSAHAQLKTAFEPDTCFQCHKDRRAQMFRASHMPMREGKIVCSDCHNPHGSATEGLIRQVSVNDNCYACHAEKRGPFLFEHTPVRENCLNCHDPHGSINDHSLKISVPRLCYECHTIGHTQSGPSEKTMGRACLNCHTNIHGSNSPAGGAFMR